MRKTRRCSYGAASTRIAAATSGVRRRSSPKAQGSDVARLTFYGAAGVVTGSKHLLETDSGSRVLLDCGLFQGLRELTERNWTPPPVDPRHLDAVVLSHAHLDHCGYLPALAQQGFKGAI